MFVASNNITSTSSDVSSTLKQPKNEFKLPMNPFLHSTCKTQFSGT